MLLTEPDPTFGAELARHAAYMEDDLRGCLTTGERAMLIDKVASYADKLPGAEEA